MIELKKKKCKQCGALFAPYSSFAKACSPRCAIDYNKGQDAKIQKKKDKEWLKVNKRVSEVMTEAQSAFNGYVRMRDYHDHCISCGTSREKVEREQGWKVGGCWDAGHFKSRGAKPQLSFNLLNCHKQCKSCNGGSGKFSRKEATVSKEYEFRLIEKIGCGAVILLSNDNTVRKFDKPYLERIKKIFNKRKRILKKRLDLL